MIIDGNELPDDCPVDCEYADDFSRFGQSSICVRCPVFNCTGTFRLMEPREYNHEWAKEWANFFMAGERPNLYFQKVK